MRHQGGKLARFAVLSAVTCGLAVGGGPAQAAKDQQKVPILGQASTDEPYYHGDRTATALVSLHGVRRTQEATVVYWSMGWTPDSVPSDSTALVGTAGSGTLGWQRLGSETTADVGVINMSEGKVYTTAYDDEEHCLCSEFTDALPLYLEKRKPGTAYVMYAVLPPIPKEADNVAVKVAGRIFTDVPVKEGKMTPQKNPEEPIVVGTGWPKADPARITKIKDLDRFIYPISKNSTILGSAVATRDEGQQQQIDISADVLFDIDEDTLTTKAKDEIKTAAKQIRKANPKGTVTITGHTDSTASTAHNQDLSERRAKAVAKEITPMLPKGVTVKTAGKGESEPIASNETDTGRAKNRRVTITLPGDDT